MEIQELDHYYNKFKYGEDIFHTLMQNRVQNILLVSTFYDAFIFEQDGRLSEQIFGEYHRLNLTRAPKITSVPTGKAALAKLEENDYDLVITMMRIGEISPFELSQKIKEKKPDLPVLLLLNVKSDLSIIEKGIKNRNNFDDIFLWNGDSSIFLAMIKYIEDQMNVEHDTQRGLVRVILLVEDDIYFYSRYLPILYHEIMEQTQLLISQALTDMQRNYRMRTRPKVLMAHNYEDAIKICEKYEEYLLSVISDIRFPRKKNGEKDPKSGWDLIEYLKPQRSEIAMLIQSSERSMSQKAKELELDFLNKNSFMLAEDLKKFIHHNLGFGDFIFRDEEGKEILRISSMEEFELALEKIPTESLAYHAKRNHFSAWLIAHDEIQVAKRLRPLTIDDFEDLESLREFLINTFREVREEKNRGNIIDFDPESLKLEYEIVRLSDGSLGGKGRGIAFLNTLLSTMEFEDKFEDVKIKIPKTAFIGTGEFDYFIDTNNMRSKIRTCGGDDPKLKQKFLAGELSSALKRKLSIYLDHITSPIAVRSSGLLEDSQSQPFAGIYQTFMLPNNHPDKAVRLQQLENAIKLVFSSTCLADAKNYTERIKYHSEEEKMAVIIQEVVGDFYGAHYYPHFSGVAQSYNYYPTSYMKHNDGISTVALGLGQWVVNGENAYRFCPKYSDLQIVPPEDLVKNSQSQFYALNVKANKFDLTKGETATLSLLDLKTAEEDGVLWHLASVWDPDDNRMRDGLYYYGPRVITFANILKYKRFPLAEILRELLEIGEMAFGVPVEIEFAVNLKSNIKKNILPTFYVLQIRPLSVHSEQMLLNSEDIVPDELILYTEKGMGNGMISEICDIIYIDPDKFDNTKTEEMKKEIQALNDKMIEENREYILIGPGRWGSRDKFLGVPVHWADIDRAKVIVETGLEDFSVEPSQGSHFFHNVVAMDVGYFSVPYKSNSEFIDWAWLKSRSSEEKTKYFVHIKSDEPFVVKMFGQKGISVIYK